MLFKRQKKTNYIKFKRVQIITRKITVCEYYNCIHRDTSYGGYNPNSPGCSICRKIRHYILSNTDKKNDKYFYIPS